MGPSWALSPNRTYQTPILGYSPCKPCFSQFSSSFSPAPVPSFCQDVLALAYLLFVHDGCLLVQCRTQVGPTLHLQPNFYHLVSSEHVFCAKGTVDFDSPCKIAEIFRIVIFRYIDFLPGPGNIWNSKLSQESASWRWFLPSQTILLFAMPCL